MHRRLNERNQITLPPDILEAVGADKGDLFEISAQAGKIILQPKDVAPKTYPDADWEGLQSVLREQTARGEYTEYGSPRTAKAHLRKLKK